MSYEIVYNRAFIKTTKGILPLLLSGSNNCTEGYGRRERRARDWGCFYFKTGLYSADDILTKIKGYTGGDYQQHFKLRGDWVDDKGLIRFYENGIKRAHTLEEYKQVLRFYILDYREGKTWEQRTKTRDDTMTVCRTTQEVENAIEKLTPLAQAQSVCLCVDFYGAEKVAYRGEQRDIKGKCVIKKGRWYLAKEQSGFGAVFTKRRDNIMIFENMEEAKKYKAKNSTLQYEGYKIFKYNENAPVKNCYVVIDKRHTFARFSRYGYRYYDFIGHYDGALMTEQRAKQVIKKLTSIYKDKTFELVKEGA